MDNNTWAITGKEEFTIGTSFKLISNINDEDLQIIHSNKISGELFLQWRTRDFWDMAWKADLQLQLLSMSRN